MKRLVICTGARHPDAERRRDRFESSRSSAHHRNSKVDGTDFYMFRSYEAGREGYVTLLANYQPLQDAYGGPNYFTLDPSAVYAIHIDNNGDAREDQSFYFRFFNDNKKLTVPVNGVNIPVPLSNIGAFGDSPAQDGNRNVIESYAVVSIKDRYRVNLAKNLSAGGTLFAKPFDNIGNKSIPNYASYADRHITRIGIDGCAGEGRVFVGQRNDGFSVKPGRDFRPDQHQSGRTAGRRTQHHRQQERHHDRAGAADLVPDQGFGADHRRLDQRLHAHAVRLQAGVAPVRAAGQRSGDRPAGQGPFHASEPRNDAQFAKYVSNPTLPILIQALFPGVNAPTRYPRADLVAAFLTGVDGLNKRRT